VALFLRDAAAAQGEGASGGGSDDMPPEIASLLVSGDICWAPDVRRGSACCLGLQPHFQLDRAEVEWVRQRTRECTIEAADTKVFRYIELFAGIGGFRLAIDALGGQCVFASELTRDARDTYAANFGDRPHGDITEIEAEDIPSFDFLTAGFPCQSFSRAGKQEGMNNSRGALFFEVTRILHHHQPRGFLLENVNNLLKVDDGAAVALIDAELAASGYHVERFVLNSSDFGCPQLRERLFFLGVRNDLLPTDGLPERLLPGIQCSHRDAREGAQVSDWGMGCPCVRPGLPTRTVMRDFLEPDSETTRECALSPHQWENIQKSSEYLQQPGYRFVKLDGQARTLTSCYKSGYLWHSEFVMQSSGLPRFFSHRECGRIMGFPDDYTFDCNTDKNRWYHQIGNAVCPPVVKAVVARFLEVYSLNSCPDV